MKQKTMKPVLIGLVALVWGLIIYKVASGLGDDDPLPQMAGSPKIESFTAGTDSFILFANYPDPFIPEEEDSAHIEAPNPAGSLPTNSFVANNPVPVMAAPPPPSFDASKVKYAGMISNPDKKMKIAIMVIDGQDCLVKEKQQVKDYKIKSITKDRVILIWKGESKVVELGK